MNFGPSRNLAWVTWPWDLVGFVHDSFKYGNLGSREKKCIFIRCPEHTKRYVLIGKQPDRTVFKIKSPDVNFVNYEFPIRCGVDESLKL